jgi:hypothetical protein
MHPEEPLVSLFSVSFPNGFPRVLVQELANHRLRNRMDDRRIRRVGIPGQRFGILVLRNRRVRKNSLSSIWIILDLIRELVTFGRNRGAIRRERSTRHLSPAKHNRQSAVRGR